MAQQLVALERGGQHLVERLLSIPAPVVTQLKPLKVAQRRERTFEHGFQSLDIGTPIAVYLVARTDQFPAPGRLRSAVKCTMAQPRVPLPQGLLKALPGAQKAGFHVELSPVQKLPTQFRSAFEEAKAIRVDQLQRQRFGKLGRTAHIAPVDADLHLAATIP